MDVAERMKLVRMIEKINEQKDFSRKLGVKDISIFKEQNTKRTIIEY